MYPAQAQRCFLLGFHDFAEYYTGYNGVFGEMSLQKPFVSADFFSAVCNTVPQFCFVNEKHGIPVGSPVFVEEAAEPSELTPETPELTESPFTGVEQKSPLRQ